MGMKALLWSRTAHRIMECLASNSHEMIETREDLYDFIRDKVDVKSVLGDGKGGLLTLSCKCISSGDSPPDLRHSHYAALTVKNALVDSCRDLRPDNARPDVNLDDPDLPLVLIRHGHSVRLYRDLDSDSLHRRGYRSDAAVHKAALKETLAAGLLLRAGWDKLIASSRVDGDTPAVLLDPMMGSGTFLLEAALIAADVAPGLMRYGGGSTLPPVLRWKGSDRASWNSLLDEARLRSKRGVQWLSQNRDRIFLQGNEIHPRAFALAQNGIQSLLQNKAVPAFADVFRIQNYDCRYYKPDVIVPGQTIVVTNPPWGKRLDDSSNDIQSSWNSLAHFLKNSADGCEAWVLSGNKALTRFLHMKKTRSFPLTVGHERLRWIQYHIFPPKS